MDEKKIADGDTVRLKSGGPVMTVEDATDPNEVSCVWFEKTTRKEGCFKAASLEKAKKPVASVIAVG